MSSDQSESCFEVDFNWRDMFKQEEIENVYQQFENGIIIEEDEDSSGSDSCPSETYEDET